MTSTQDKSTLNNSQESQSTMTPHKCRLSHSHNLTCFVGDSLAKLSRLLGKGKDSVTPEARSFLKLLELLKKNSHRFYFSKMSKVYSTTTTEKPLEPSSVAWMKWGMTVNGNSITANIMSHKTGNVSTLSDILEDNVPDKYFLSEESTVKLISRSNKL